MMLFLPQPCRIKGNIGQSTDDDSPPLVHCVRLLSASFLLTGEKKGKAGGGYRVGVDAHCLAG